MHMFRTLTLTAVLALVGTPALAVDDEDHEVGEAVESEEAAEGEQAADAEQAAETFDAKDLAESMDDDDAAGIERVEDEEEIPEDAPLMPQDHPPVHTPPDQLAEWMPDTEAMNALVAEYRDFTDERLSVEDEEANMALLTEIKPQELDAIIGTSQEIIAGGGTEAIAAAFLSANALLYFADLGYSLKPTPRMDDKQKRKFTRILEREVYPTLKPIDKDARAYLTSIADAAKDGSDWDMRAKGLLAQMDSQDR